MNLQKLPALLLAAALQVLPICRVAYVNAASAPTGFAIVMRWLAGAVALLGSYHAVSGASAAVPGVAPINPTTQIQTGPVTTNAVGTNGQIFAYRIIVTNPGVNPQQAYYYADPLPPGLTINTNLGGNGDITGVPTAPGAYAVKITAGNANYANTVSTNITITISGTGSASPPSITTPPANQTVTAGANVAFTVTATGTAPLHYAWSFNGTAIPAGTTSSLQLTNVQTGASGTYSVTVTNTAGSKSASATLTVNAAATGPSISQQPQSLTLSNGASANFSVAATGTAPLSYQWLKDTVALPNATNAAYSIASVTTNDAGGYSVIVTNASGSMTSSVATLTVLLPPSSAALQLGNWAVGANFFSFDVSGPSQTNFVIWSSTDLSHWTSVGTNFSATGTVHFSDTNSAGATEFFRATLSP